jgi:hypothetical protein
MDADGRRDRPPRLLPRAEHASRFCGTCACRPPW